MVSPSLTTSHLRLVAFLWRPEVGCVVAKWRTSMRVMGILKAVALALGVSVLPASAATVTVNVDGRFWDIRVPDFAFAAQDALRPQLEDQPWWGNEALARQFATAVGARLGTCGGVGNGPCFAFNNSSIVPNILVASFNSSGGSVFNVNPFTIGLALAREVSPPPVVPLPAGGLLLLSGLAAAAVAGKRRRNANV